MASAGPANPDTVAIKVKTLMANQLKQILKKEGLAVSGVKAALQTRIIDRKSQILHGEGQERWATDNDDSTIFRASTVHSEG